MVDWTHWIRYLSVSTSTCFPWMHLKYIERMQNKGWFFFSVWCRLTLLLFPNPITVSTTIILFMRCSHPRIRSRTGSRWVAGAEAILRLPLRIHLRVARPPPRQTRRPPRGWRRYRLHILRRQVSRQPILPRQTIPAVKPLLSQIPALYNERR